MLDYAIAQKTCRFEQICFSLGATLLTFGFAVFALDSLTLICHGSIAAWQGWVALGISGGFCVIQPGRNSTRSQIVVLAIALGVIGLSLLISGAFYDLSWDGQTYHQEAILQLGAGWNPFCQTLADSVEHSVWLNHYPRTSWILATSLYQITHRLETAKAFNPLFLASSFFLSVGALRALTSVTKLQAGIIAALLAFNPIVIAQVLNFTIDGQVASLLLILGIILCLIGAEVEHFPLLLLFAAFSTVLLLNEKFTALIYATVFILSLLGWLFYKNRKAFYRATISLMLCIFTSVIGFGFNPYVTNVLNHGTPFYPLMGRNKIDIISDHIPANFFGKSRVEKLFVSLLAQSDAKLNTIAQLKIPFSVQRRELLAVQDARVGGFGVLFSGALCLSLVVFGMSWLQPFRLGLISALTILASTLINPEAWWARYVPQFWFLAPISILPGFMIHTSIPNRKVLRFCSYALVLVLSLNCFAIGAAVTYRAVQGNRMIQQQLHQLAQLNVKQVVVKYGLFRGNRSRFTEQGITWTEVKAEQLLPCRKPLNFYQSQTVFCPISKL
ncbi:MAG: hypothetical protein KME18_07040 [Phormidium tanganyikae FI6-MK23]|jgi:hypothetical protein|nr:hypothetical protein [Phormidium tanganyikae FI6-MK23]